MKTLRLFCILLMGFICCITKNVLGANYPGVQAPLANVTLEAVGPGTTILRATITLNAQLPSSHLYNIGVFLGGPAVMVGCDAYAIFNGCYFPQTTTSSVIQFLVIGDFPTDWHTNKYAFVIAFSAPSPQEVGSPTLGPFVSKNTEGILTPIRSSATQEYFPFSRL